MPQPVHYHHHAFVQIPCLAGVIPCLGSKETRGLETIVERDQSTTEVQGETESLGTSVDGKSRTREERGETGRLGKVVVANRPARDRDKKSIG